MAQDQDIDVSVIVPCYNTEAFLDQALTTCEKNDSCRLEIIAVNDGSTDGSLAIMREHEARDPRVRVIDKENSGYGASMNRGIREARGTYIGILEPDDYLRPHMFDTLFEAAERHGMPDMVKPPYIRVWMPTTPQERLYNCAYYHRIKPVDEPFTLKDCPRLIRHHPSIWSAIYRKGFLQDNDITFMEVPGAGWVDNPFLIQTCVLAKSIVYIDEPFYCYREDLPGSSSVLRKAGLAFERWGNMADLVEKYGVTDRGILESLYIIGFRYAGGAIDDFGLDEPQIHEWVTQMFRRMDPNIVAGIAALSGSFKHTYFELTGYPAVKFSDLPYIGNLVNEFFYSWRINGPGFAFSRLGLFARRRAAEKGLAKPTSTHSASI